VNAKPRPLYCGKRKPVPTVQDDVWAHSLPGWLPKTSPPPVFDPRAVQHVASRYTDYVHTNTVLIDVHSAHIHTDVHTYLHTDENKYIHTTYSSTLIHIFMHAYIETYVRMYIHTHTHTHTRTHTHTHTHTLKYTIHTYIQKYILHTYI
jgi:hypothetical protein